MHADENGGNSIKGSGFRTLQGFGSADLTGEEFYDIYKAYYGSSTYGDDFVSAALAGTDAGDLMGDFSAITDDERVQLAKKGSAYINVWIYALHEYEAAITKCNSDDYDTEDVVHTWDEGWAFYAGSKQKTGSSSKGALLYYLAQKRCSDFGTCGSDGVADVNAKVLEYTIAGAEELIAGDCSGADAYLDKIKVQMKIPLIQGMLKYAYFGDPNGGGANGDDLSEGWAFPAAILPLIDDCDSTVATYVADNMMVSLSSPMADGYVDVKTEVESTYTCLGITCDDVGAYSTVWDACVASPACTPTAMPTGDDGPDEYRRRLQSCDCEDGDDDEAYEYRRRLQSWVTCESPIAGYTPYTDVTEHAKIDLDQIAMEDYLSDSNFTGATYICASSHSDTRDHTLDLSLTTTTIRTLTD